MKQAYYCIPITLACLTYSNQLNMNAICNHTKITPKYWGVHKNRRTDTYELDWGLNPSRNLLGPLPCARFLVPHHNRTHNLGNLPTRIRANWWRTGGRLATAHLRVVVKVRMSFMCRTGNKSRWRLAFDFQPFSYAPFVSSGFGI